MDAVVRRIQYEMSAPFSLGSAPSVKDVSAFEAGHLEISHLLLEKRGLHVAPGVAAVVTDDVVQVLFVGLVVDVGDQSAVLQNRQGAVAPTLNLERQLAPQGEAAAVIGACVEPVEVLGKVAVPLDRAVVAQLENQDAAVVNHRIPDAAGLIAHRFRRFPRTAVIRAAKTRGNVQRRPRPLLFGRVPALQVEQDDRPVFGSHGILTHDGLSSVPVVDRLGV